MVEEVAPIQPPQPVQPSQVTVINHPVENYTLDEVVRITKAIETKVTEGFKGVHERQNITNGGVKTANDWINKHGTFVEDLERERKDNYKRFMDLFWKVVAMLAIGALVVIGAKNIIDYIK